VEAVSAKYNISVTTYYKWQKQYAVLVDGETYATILVGYIRLNPIRKRVKKTIQYTGTEKDLNRFMWSSH
jgi:hypothetical protein